MASPKDPQLELLASLMDSAEVVEFLKHFRPVECSSCFELLALQNRATGTIHCPPQGKDHSRCYETLMSMKKPLMLGATPIPSPIVVGSDAAMRGRSPIVKRTDCVDHNNSTPGTIALKSSSSSQVSNLKARDGETFAGKAASEGASNSRKKGPTNVLLSYADRKELEMLLKEDDEEMNSDKRNKPFFWTDCSYSPNLTEDALVHAEFIWNPAKLLIMAVADKQPIAKLQAMLNSYVETATQFKEPPSQGEVVVAKYYDGNCYRGRVTSLHEDSCNVTFIDFGDEASFKYSHIFPANEEITKCPVFGLIVQLEGLPKEAREMRLTQELEFYVYTRTFVIVKLGVICMTDDTPTTEARLIELGEEKGLSDVFIRALWPRTSAVAQQGHSKDSAQPSASTSNATPRQVRPKPRPPSSSSSSSDDEGEEVSWANIQIPVGRFALPRSKIVRMNPVDGQNCRLCGKTFQTRPAAMRHCLQYHGKPRICPICRWACLSEREYRKHIVKCNGAKGKK